MKHIACTSTRVHVVQLKRGDDLIAALVNHAKNYGIKAAQVSGIGAVDNVEIGAYKLAEKKYARQKLPGDWELVSLAGNITIEAGGNPVLHAHAVLSDEQGATRAGHLFSARAAITVELFVDEVTATIERHLDEETGLKLWKLA